MRRPFRRILRGFESHTKVFVTAVLLAVTLHLSLTDWCWRERADGERQEAYENLLGYYESKAEYAVPPEPVYFTGLRVRSAAKLGRIIGGIAIPIALVFFGSLVALAIQNRSRRSRFPMVRGLGLSRRRRDETRRREG